jgi:glycogen synthase|tara:strand:- start:494 stop:832 length:339 start_codon:yes stop_codon:yes gene_type:complete
MIRAFKIYVVLTVLGLSFRLYWDLNHVFKWIKDGDFFFGVGIALILIAGAIYIDSTKSNGWAKVFTRFALFTAVSNLCDEVMFNPYIVSWQEWVTALVVLIGVYFYERYNKI